MKYEGESESGVPFRLSYEVKEDGYCILFFRSFKKEEELEKAKACMIPIFLSMEDLETRRKNNDVGSIIEFAIKLLEEKISYERNKRHTDKLTQ